MAQWIRHRPTEPGIAGSSPAGVICHRQRFSAGSSSPLLSRPGNWHAPKKRRGGGIEPLHVSMPRELKSRPSTSPTHPGFQLILDMQNVLWTRRRVIIGYLHTRCKMTAVGFEPTPLRNGALSHRLRPLGQTVLAVGPYSLIAS